MTQPVDQTPEERAREIVSQFKIAIKETPGATILSFNQDGMMCLIASALADERRRVWEEAAKLAEEKAERSIKGEHLNIPEYNFGYRGGLRGLADEIRLKLYAKAHAGQEG